MDALNTKKLAPYCARPAGCDAAMVGECARWLKPFVTEVPDGTAPCGGRRQESGTKHVVRAEFY